MKNEKHHPVKALEKPVPFEYVDANLNIEPDTYQIKDAYEVADS